MKNNNEQKERQVENLVNLVEKHTRTERHLEQYSHIGSKEKAREKQDVREKEIEKLKNKITSNNNESKVEQVQNLADNYRGAQIYMEENYEKMSEEKVKNMENKQQHRKEQIESLSENIYNEEN